MNKKEIQERLQSFIPELFNFSYAIIPDDLQSNQIVVDIFSIFFIKEKEFIEELLAIKVNSNEEILILGRLRDKLYGLVFQMAKKRSQHFNLILDERSELKKSLIAFYQLKLDERVILYLWDKMKGNYDLMTSLLSINQNELIPLLTLARNKLSNKLGLEHNSTGAVFC